MMRGKGLRCFGFLSSDREFYHCTRSELAGQLQPHRGANGGDTYAHRLTGSCKCGQQHGAEVRSIGESKRAEIVATYDYVSEQGELLYQVVRMNPKAFLQRRPDGKGGWIWKLGDVQPSLFKLPELIAAVTAGDRVYIAEGEKDVLALMRAGVAATCNSGGAGKFPAAMAKHFRGADVVLIRDKDEPGHQHARDVYAKLRGVVGSFSVVEARRGKDAADHLVVHTVDEFLSIWPIDPSTADGKRAILRTSLQVEEPLRHVKYCDAIARPPLPTWPTGLDGQAPELPNFRGVSIVTGKQSAGKSFLTIGSSIAAAQFGGWDVRYVIAEMSDLQVAQRAEAYCNGAPPPENWEMLMADFGADIDVLIELLCERMTDKRTLIVLDSINSFSDQKLENGKDDPQGWMRLRRLIMWAINVKRKSHGQVSFMILSEANAQGETKGRFGDHKADLVLTVESDELDKLVKTLTIVKAWEYRTGPVGSYTLDPRTATLKRCNS